MPAPNEITVSQLNRLIGTPTCPEIIDICIEGDFAADPFLIPGARRHPHTDVPGLIQSLTSDRVVIVCQKGLKLSQGLASRLRSDAIRADYLQGGVYAWRDDADTLRYPFAALPPQTDGATLWVTRHRPKVDRIACPWLIRRFIDRDARFLFVSPSEVGNVAEKYNATPFDTADVALSHHGDRCSFDAISDAFNLTSPALTRMADVIRAADTNRHDLHPAAAGLLALSVGLSRQYRDDHDQLKAGLPLYDALYRWARDGYDETHQSPKPRSA